MLIYGLRISLAALHIVTLTFATPEPAQAQSELSPESFGQAFQSVLFETHTAKITKPFGLIPNGNYDLSSLQNGVDVSFERAAATIFAPASGQIVRAGPTLGFGGILQIQLVQSGDIITLARLTAIFVETGAHVKPGMPVARVWSTRPPEKGAGETGVHIQYSRRGAFLDPEGVPGLKFMEAPSRAK